MLVSTLMLEWLSVCLRAGGRSLTTSPMASLGRLSITPGTDTRATNLCIIKREHQMSTIMQVGGKSDELNVHQRFTEYCVSIFTYSR